MQNKQRKAMFAADVVNQLPRRSDGYALGRDDHQIVTVREIHRLEKWIKTLLFAE